MKKVNKARIWDKLNNRFLLSDWQSEPPTMSEQIIPVTDVNELTRDTKIAQHADDLSTGTAYVTYFTVPEGKRWTLLGFVRASSAGNTKVRLRIDGEPFELTTSGTAYERNISMNPIPLKEGDIIQMKGTANVSDTNINLQIIYIEEDAY